MRPRPHLSSDHQSEAAQARIGMALMASAMLYVPAIDVFAKLLAESLSPIQVAWFRFLTQFVFLMPVWWLVGSIPRRDTWVSYLIRGLFMAIAAISMIFGVHIMPVADCITIFFIEPLVLTLLAVPILGEKIGPRRIAAVLIGFAGAVIALQPSFEEVGFGVLYPVVAAFSFAGYMVTSRYFASREDAMTMQFTTSGVGLFFVSLILVLVNLMGFEFAVWKSPVGLDFVYILALGLIATVGHIQLVAAIRRSEAGLLAPFQYLEIITATLLGFLVFGDFPEPETWIGVVIIIGAGLYVFRRGHQAKA